MDTSRYRRKQIKAEVDAQSELYPHNLSMYMSTPVQSIQLSEFEDLAVERLSVLRIIEYCTQIGNKIYSAEWKNAILHELKKQNLQKYVHLLKGDAAKADMNARRDDHVSHYILRLAYCRTEELRRWFLNRELELFKLRLMNNSDESINDFMKIYNLEYQLVTEEEKQHFRNEITSSTSGHFVLDATTFYKVHFLQVLPLMQHHKVFMRHGMAYVPGYEISTCIVSAFRSSLNEFLSMASKRLANIADTRIIYFLRSLHEAYTGKTYDLASNSAGKVNLTNLNLNAKEHFPLCMRSIHDVFRGTHHIKHFSRLQYMFFLKGLGMIFEDVMELWREEFMHKVDHDKFEKQYAYSVKHAFGKVGRMANYSPYSCGKIISASVGPGETHGCPYKHWDDAFLKTKLEESGMNAMHIAEIIEVKQAGHFQIACGKYFQFAYGHENENPITHPNQYFEDSYNLKHKGEKLEDAVATPVPAPSTQSQV